MELFESYGLASVAAIVVICYLIGMAVKNSGIDNKWIPVICGVAGAVLGVVGMFCMPDFPGHDIINSIAYGIVSGLSATGINQLVKQLGGASNE